MYSHIKSEQLSDRDVNEARSVRGRGRGQSGLTINSHIDDRHSKYDWFKTNDKWHNNNNNNNNNNNKLQLCHS